MKYLGYVNKVMSVEDLEKYKKAFEKDIINKQQELLDFIEQSEERIKTLEEYEANKQYKILGHTGRDGRNKYILLIIRYVDMTQREERYIFSKIADLRVKLKELKEKYSGVDWSGFDEEI